MKQSFPLNKSVDEMMYTFMYIHNIYFLIDLYAHRPYICFSSSCFLNIDLSVVSVSEYAHIYFSFFIVMERELMLTMIHNISSFLSDSALTYDEYARAV